MTGLTGSVRAVGIAWYRTQDYRQIRQIIADAACFPATYREWREESEHLENDLKRLVHVVVRAVVDPEIFSSGARPAALILTARLEQNSPMRSPTSRSRRLCEAAIS